MSSLNKELGATYELVFAASVEAFLMQVRGARAVRVVAVTSGGTAPAADSEDYFLISNQSGHTNALGRVGLEGMDLYMRANSNKDTAFVVGSPLTA